MSLRFPGEKPPKKTRLPKEGLQLVFEERTRQIYGGMKSRYGDKKKDGKVIKAGRPLPFTLGEFRRWLLKELGGSWDSAISCPYCNRLIHIGDLVVDHKTPTAPPWSGPLGLSNLIACCEEDNTRKGKMSAAGYKSYITWANGFECENGMMVRNLDPRDFADQLGRMASGAAAIRMRLELLEARKTIGALRAQLAGRGPARGFKPKGLFR